MSGWLALGALVAVVATVQVVVCALLVGVFHRWLRPRLEAAAMAGRTHVLVMFAALPALSAGVLIAACMGPSAITELGLAADHCLSHFDHALHLCLQHLPNRDPSGALAVVLGTGAALALSSLWRAARLTQSGRHEAKLLEAIATEREGIGWIESRVPMALTVGLWKPRVYVSSGLANGLDELELRAAVAHERCHARERHALLKWLATAAAMFHLPAVRRDLQSWLDLACERRADEQAAVEVDRVRVASALVRTHRLVGTQTALAFANGNRRHLDQRVRALLEDGTPDGQRTWLGWLGVVVVSTAALAHHELHHGVEHLLELIV